MRRPGYITGSGWKDYQATGSVSGMELPSGLRESERLPDPIFTPSTKALEGHDEAIDLAQASDSSAIGLVERVAGFRSSCTRSPPSTRSPGVILADTKFEFGLDEHGELVVGDEVLTRLLRYWPAEGFEVGRSQPSFDKQYVRDWASASGWDKAPAGAGYPRGRRRGHGARYVEAYERITGEPFQAWLDRVESAAERADTAAERADTGADGLEARAERVDTPAL